MQLFAQWAQQLNQPALNGEMDILCFKAGIEISCSRFTPNGLEPLDELLALLATNQSAPSEHAGMGHGAIKVLLQQGDVKTDRGVEPLDAGVKTLLEAIAPAQAGTACNPVAHGHRHTLNRG